MPNIQYFTPDVSAGASAQPTVAVVALPNSADTLLYLVNLGPNDVVFKLGATNTVTVTPSTGMVLGAGKERIVGSAGMGYIALITAGGTLGSTVNLTSGN